MKKTALLMVLAAIALVSCNKKETGASFNTVLPVKEIMGHIIDPASFAYWHASGFIDEVGNVNGAVKTTSLMPTTEEGWINAESGAIQIAEAGNLLMLPGRARDNGDWMKFAKALNKAGMDAQAATEERDETKMFKTGGEIYEVCTECHQKYLLPFLGPDGEPLKGGPLDPGASK